MDKTAYNHAQGGHDDYDETVRERLRALRRSVAAAKSALLAYAEPMGTPV